MKFYALILAILFTFACKKDENPNTNADARHIKYFGFTLIDTYWDDPTDSSTKTNYLDEVSSFSNVADILVVSPEDDLKDRISRMDQVGVKCVLHISELFFKIVDNKSSSGANYDLRADYKKRWDAFIATNNLNGSQLILYLGEEPTWNGISFEELNAASEYIKSTVPEAPILIIEASPSIKDLRIPASVDWIGFDHYFIKDPYANTSFKNELKLLKSKFTQENQKLVLVMDTHYISKVHGDLGKIELSEMKDVAISYYTLAKEETKTIAILGYFWPSGFDAKESIGARNMPAEIKNEYEKIGKEITGKN